jgi:ribonuclease D
MERHARGMLQALERARASQEDLRRPQAVRPQVPPDVQRRAAALRRWRAERARTLELDVAVVLPQRLIDALAEAGPRDAAGLARVEGLRRWRSEAFGAEILAAMAPN